MKSSSLIRWLLLAAPLFLGFTMHGDEDRFSFYLSTERIYYPGEPDVAVTLGGQLESKTTFAFEAYRLADPVAFFRAQRNPHSFNIGFDDDGERDDKEPRVTLSKNDKLIKRWEKKITPRERYWHNEQISVPANERGVYVVVARARGKASATVVVVSALGMVVKQSPGEALSFVVDRRSGEKVTGFPLSYLRGGELLLEGSTDASGVSRVTVPEKKAPTGSDGDLEIMRWSGYGDQLIVLGEKNDDFIISDSYFYSNPDSKGQVYLHTDRPVYRPGQTVHYRGIVRRIGEDGTYRNVTDDTVAVEITDARGRSVSKDTLALSDFGTFSGEIVLGEEPPLGDYQIQVHFDGAARWFSFAVEEYKKPEYEVTVTTDREQYTRGDRITASVRADYYFGEPVAGAQIEYFIYRSRFWRPWWYRSEWAYLYEGDERGWYGGGGSEMIHTGEGTLGADGTYRIEYTTDKKAGEDYLYRIEARVVDASRRSVSGSASARVTRGEFSMTTWTDKYLYKPGDRATIFVKALSFEGDKGVSVPFRIRVERVWWEERRKGRGGEQRKETIWNGSGSTDGSGQGSVTFTPEKTGYYNVVAEATDGRGTKIEESGSMYVADNTYDAWYNEGGVQIIPDKQLYKPGDMMSALIVMPESGGDLLVTGEGAALYTHQVERLNSRSVVVRMKIEERYAPMFYLSVNAIRDGTFQSNMQQITVAPEGKRLRLQVTTDREEYKPGEKGTVTVRVLNDQGEPAPNTDVAVSMVDEALYAIRPDRTPDIQKAFYGYRNNAVSTTTSLYFRFATGSRVETEMLAGDMAEGAVAGRDAFASAPPAAPQMSKAARGFAANQADGSAAYVEAEIRRTFEDLMYWTPSVRTDGSGRARIEVTFPDNLTTWRITARGVTQATAVGQATAEVIARKDLLVRMETPRFITAGDRLAVATTIHNYLASAKKARVRMKAEGAGLKESEKIVTVPASGEIRVDWEIDAAKAGTAKLTVEALTDEESDAMEISLPILPRGLRTENGSFVQIDEKGNDGTITLTIPDNADPSTSEIFVTVSPSPASSVVGALDALIGYPYGCVEQTMSRFLPTVVVADALKKIDVPFDAKKREELPKMVAKGFNRLYNLQHDDGGWGWWENDGSNPFMTAYVLYGMTIARRAGYEVDTIRFANGISALKTAIEQGSSDDEKNTTMAYMLYTASMIGGDFNTNEYRSKIENLSRRRNLNSYAKALLALAGKEQGMTDLASRMAAALESAASVTGTAASWKGMTWHYNWQDDEVETTAFAVKALLEVRGENDLVRKGVQWLVSHKGADSWHNTRQTAMVIYALADLLKRTSELSPDYTATVAVNGRQIFSEKIDRKDLFTAEKRIRIDGSSLVRGANTITVGKSGAGRLYSSARVVYYVTGDAIKPAANGFKVTREYFTLNRVKRSGGYIHTKAPFKGTVKSGDEIFVKVTIRPERSHEYFMLEDPLPAGCEVVTSTEGYTIRDEEEYGGVDYGKRGYGRRMIWNWWYADRDVRDEKITFFAPSLEDREYTFSYIMRAQIPGTYGVMPSIGALMYYPEVRGNSGALNLTITE